MRLPNIVAIATTIAALTLTASAPAASVGADDTRDAAGGGITLAPPAPHKDGEIRVLVYHDMEGMSGQDDYRTFNFWQPDYYPKGQELLAADINAVVDGLFAGGATKVEIVDAHGSGNPDPDLVPAKLDKRATQLTRDARFRQYVDIVEPGKYDAVVAVAMHAKTGSGGFASHTFTLGMDIILNGRSITETELVALSWGRAGVPFIFASGDDKLAKDLQTMPWIRFVTTKKATSASTVELRDVDTVHAEMRAQAADAVRSLAKAKVMTIGAPVQASLRAVAPASLAMLKDVPGVALSASGDTVSFAAKDFGAAYDGIVALIGVGTGSYSRVLDEVARARPDSAELLMKQREALMMRWLDVESGRYQAPPPPSPTPGRKYYGAQ